MTVLLQQEYAASGLLGVTELLGGPLCYTDRPHTKRGGNGSLWPVAAEQLSELPKWVNPKLMTWVIFTVLLTMSMKWFS